MAGIGTAVSELVFERAMSDPALPEASRNLVVAALDGPAALQASMAGTAALADCRPGDAEDHDELRGIYLKSIRAHGFRGVGPAATLELNPGPGLTVVTGRNGSGKSSFAEAAELVLTGTSSRWNDKQNNPALWRGGWRNLHAPSDTEITVELVSTGEPGAVTLQMGWADGADLDSAVPTVQRTEQNGTRGKRGPLDRSLLPDHTRYRPFLSYGELGAIVDKRPTELFKALHGILGLGALEEAGDLLKSARGPLDVRVKELGQQKAALLTEFASVDDDRARRAEALLAPAKPDVEALGDLALGTDAELSTIGDLRAVVAITLPDAGDVERVCAAVRETSRTVATAATTDATSSDAVLSLLRTALEHHAGQDDETCPVCGTGVLDQHWRDRTRAEIDRLSHVVHELHTARQHARVAVADARGLITAAPAVLSTSRIDVAAEWAVWEAARSADPELLPDAIHNAHVGLRSALDAAQAAARAELARLDETWRPVAARLWTWCDAADAVTAESATISSLKVAETWLKKAVTTLGNELFAPFRARAQDIWADLRQESNVELEDITLTGTGAQRKANLAVTVDGSATSALSVMSQGELHALGLALFLPRATREESPFRFVMIDDPVQAMDPAKVNGLARVLAAIAIDRQVVVFSHDDRLADAVRRLPDAATILEVQRRDRSQVQVAVSNDPVSRYLSDAKAVVHDDQLPDELRREIVANCCRGALDAAAITKIRGVRLGRGHSHADVDATLATVKKTHHKIALAVFDEPDRDSDLYGRLSKDLGPWAVDVVKACKEGAHGADCGDLTSLVNDTGRVVTWIQQR